MNHQNYAQKSITCISQYINLQLTSEEEALIFATFLTQKVRKNNAFYRKAIYLNTKTVDIHQRFFLDLVFISNVL